MLHVWWLPLRKSRSPKTYMHEKYVEELKKGDGKNWFNNIMLKVVDIKLNRKRCRKKQSGNKINCYFYQECYQNHLIGLNLSMAQLTSFHITCRNEEKKTYLRKSDDTINNILASSNLAWNPILSESVWMKTYMFCFLEKNFLLAPQKCDKIFIHFFGSFSLERPSKYLVS